MFADPEGHRGELTTPQTVLTRKQNGYNVHFGCEENETVILAVADRQRLRYIPRSRFYDGRNSDLPRPLIDDYVHWL